jgi:hypothetical protein
MGGIGNEMECYFVTEKTKWFLIPYKMKQAKKHHLTF